MLRLIQVFMSPIFFTCTKIETYIFKTINCPIKQTFRRCHMIFTICLLHRNKIFVSKWNSGSSELSFHYKSLWNHSFGKKYYHSDPHIPRKPRIRFYLQLLKKNLYDLKKLNFYYILSNLNKKYKIFSFIWKKNDCIIFTPWQDMNIKKIKYVNIQLTNIFKINGILQNIF